MATRQIAQGLASLGRNGDTMLMHVQPQEVAGLQALANANGTTLTINPDTGLPEAFSLGGFFKSLLPTIVGGAATAATGGLTAGILAGAATGALTNKEDPLMGALMGGIGGYGGGNIAQSFANPALSGGLAEKMIVNAGEVPQIAAIDPNVAGFLQPTGAEIGANMGAINPANIPGGGVPLATSTPAGQGGLGFGSNTNMADAWGGVKPTSFTASDQISRGFQTALNDPGAYYDSIGGAMGTAKLYGMPLTTAALGGLEPSDLGYGGIDMAEAGNAQRYDPYARLNLGGASSRGGSGLRLLAASGGEIKSYAEGGLTEDGSRTLGAQELGLAQMMPVGIASLPQAQAGAPEIETKLPANQPSQVNIDIMQMKEPQAGLMQQAEQGAPIPELMQQQGGQGLNYQNMFGASQATRGYGPDGQMLASGGPVSFAAGGPAAPEASAPAMGTFATRAQEQRIQAAHDESVRAAQAASRNVQNSYGIPFFQNNAKSAGRPGQQNVMGFWVDPPGYQAPQSPKFTTRSQAIAGGRGTNFGGRNTRVFAGRGMRLAAGGNIGTGGIADLYGASDAQIGPPLSEGGYGLSRLSNLASEQAQNRAGAGSFSQGGSTAFNLEDGGFVIPADVVFYAGGHDTDAGQKLFAEKFGGVPIKGPGNGLSDDIPAVIKNSAGGTQRAAVADNEVYIPKRNVEAAGGPKKFYKMMDKVRKQAHGSKKQAKPAKV